jgi:hypothetical protein
MTPWLRRWGRSKSSDHGPLLTRPDSTSASQPGSGLLGSRVWAGGWSRSLSDLPPKRGVGEV